MVLVLRTALASALLLVTAPLAAQTLADTDALSDQTTEEAAGLALAGQQTERGALLEALSTLERVLALFPKSRAARFDHAMLLCRVGDRQGAEVEFARLKASEYAPGQLQQARAACRQQAQGE